MATRRAPWTARLFEILTDRQWHDQTAVIDACRQLVPPGVAYRAGEHDRTRKHTARGTTPTRTIGCQDQSITTGAWLKVHGSIKSQIHLGHIQRRYRNGRPQIRLAQRPAR